MSTFKIIKKGANNFWHWFNNDAKKVAISSFAVVLEEVSQTFSIVYINGANVPQQAVSVLDIEVIDETDVSLVETFTNVIDLRARLVELGYTAYLIGGGIDNITGLIAEGANVTITGDGTLASPYVISVTGGGAVDSVNGQIGVVVLDADDISDTSTTKKFVTTTEKNTWNSKEPQITEGTTSQYYRGDKTFQTLNKSAVGLSNVDNTSDANKPVSTPQAEALALKSNIDSTFPMRFQFSASSPLDSTTYYVGGSNNLILSTTNNRFVYAGITATTFRVSIFIYNTGTLGTSENATITLLNNTQATSIVLTTTAKFNSTSFGFVGNFTFAVTEGDSLSLKIDCPAYATNPTSVIGGANLILKQ